MPPIVLPSATATANCGNCRFFEPGLPRLYINKIGVRSNGFCRLPRFGWKDAKVAALSTNWCDQHKQPGDK